MTAAGEEPRAPKLAQAALERAAQIEGERDARLAERDAMRDAVAAMWSRGDSLAVIAGALGLASVSAAAGRISWFRGRYPAMFPRRKGARPDVVARNISRGQRLANLARA